MKKLSIIFFCAIAFYARATNHYIDNTATGANDGSSWANAWTSYTALSQANWNSTAAGDIIYISGGSNSQTYSTYYPYNNNYMDFSDRTLQVGQDAGHNGMVVIDGLGVQAQFLIADTHSCTISGDNGSGDGLPHMSFTNFTVQVVTGDNSSDIKLDHLAIINSNVRFQSATNIELSYCQITAPNGSDYVVNFHVTGPAGSTVFTNNSIHDCTLLAPRNFVDDGTGSDFIQGGQNCSVYNNSFSVYFCTFTEGQHQDGWQAVGPYLAMFNNHMENIANYGLFCEFIGSGSDILFYNNVVVQNAAMTNDMGFTLGVAVGPQGVSGYTYSNIVVANNTFVDMFGRGAAGLGQPYNSNVWVNCAIINNLVYNSGNSNSAALFFQNMQGGVASSNGVTIAYNEIESGTFGNTNSDPGQLLTPAGTPPVKFVSYTLISPSNDLHLATNDLAATGQGINLTGQYPFLATDKAGNARAASGNWDIGAYVANTNSPVIPAMRAWLVPIYFRQ